jgi:hypothetical protein
MQGGQMSVARRWKLIGGAAAAVAVLGGGGAFAATELDSPSATSQAIINDAAGQLGVQPDKLTSALQKALEDQLQADVTAGRLTQAQADAQKAMIESGKYPLLGTGGFGFGRGGFGGHGRPGGFGGFGGPLLADLSTAATSLGLTTDQLKTDLQGGKTLAQIATAQGQTPDQLVSTLVAAVEKQLDAAVTANKLTSAQEQAIEKNLQQQITALVNGTPPTFGKFKAGTFKGGFFRRHGGSGFSGPGFGGPGLGHGGPGGHGGPTPPPSTTTTQA